MPHSINHQITITANNKWLDVWDAVGGAQSVALTEQTYEDIVEICTDLEALLQALGGTWAAATVDVVFDQAILGKIRIHSNQAINATSILWNTGAHGSGFLDTHCGDILGFADAADDAGAYYYNSDYQHQYGWYATRAIRSYTPLLGNHVGSQFRTTLSREYGKILTIGYEWVYEMRLEAIEPEQMIWYLATGANLNRALDLGPAIQGNWFRIREDMTDFATYMDCYLLEPREQYGNLTRKYDDYECYDLTIKVLVVATAP